MKTIKTFENFHNNLKSCIIIHGLPGSGKTSLANKIAETHKDKDYLILDDKGRGMIYSKILENSRNIIISSPYIEEYMDATFGGSVMRKKIIEIAKEMDYYLYEIWFENDKKRCIFNLENRKDHLLRSEEIIPEMSNWARNYIIPNGVKTIPILGKYKKINVTISTEPNDFSKIEI